SWCSSVLLTPGEHERGAGVRARQSRVVRAVTQGEGPPAPVAGSASGAGLTGDNASGSLQPLVLRSDDRTSTTLPNSLRPEGVGHNIMLAGPPHRDIKPLSIIDEISMKNASPAHFPSTGIGRSTRNVVPIRGSLT